MTERRAFRMPAPALPDGAPIVRAQRERDGAARVERARADVEKRRLAVLARAEYVCDHAAEGTGELIEWLRLAVRELRAAEAELRGAELAAGVP